MKWIEEIIESHPQELESLRSASSWHTLSQLVSSLPPAAFKKKRVKPKDDTEKRRRIKNSKRRYDSLRTFERNGPGLIEGQFGVPATFKPTTPLIQALFGAGPNDRLEGNCLDKLFGGDGLPMTGWESLEGLFGRSRKLLPKNLHRLRQGRTFIYGYPASDGAIVGTFHCGSQPYSALFDGTNIWVTNQPNNQVAKLRASDGVLLGFFPTGSSPTQLAFDGANVWIANSNTSSVNKF